MYRVRWRPPTAARASSSGRRSLGYVEHDEQSRLSINLPQLPAATGFDTLALVKRLPASVRAIGWVKCARPLAVFSRFDRFLLELRGGIVVMLINEPDATSDTDSTIAGVFCVEGCIVNRVRAGGVKLEREGEGQNVWLKFEDDSEADLWVKALRAAAGRRVVGISDFEFMSPIGKGASGKVFLVTDRKTGEKLALKVIDKAKVFESKSGFRHALDERLALEMVDGHPFFTRLRYAFQTKAFFYLAIDFYDGGDLYQYLRTHSGRLREAQVKNVAAEVALALEHLHNLGFVYRDLKPENVLLDSEGHVRLADFGLCKVLKRNALTNTICGTHTYAAPEMLAVRNYGFSIDLWAYGVFVYHILRGRTPYEARDLDQVIANMNNRRIRFSSNTSEELVSMIKKLLDWNPETRLGCGILGMVEVRGHSFFSGTDWRRVYMREESGLFTKPKKQARRLQREIYPSSDVSEQSPIQPTTAVTSDANDTGEAPSLLVSLGESADSNCKDRISPLKRDCGDVDEITPLHSKPGELGMQDSCAMLCASTATEESDETGDVQKKGRIGKNKRISRPKSLGHIGMSKFSVSNKERKFVRILSEQDQSQSVSLREKMATAAEQDDLRNFDMSEWGKISVDNDRDDANYGDSSLWPISKARRKLVEDERMIVGFSYCSSSTPFVLPDNL